MVPPLSQPENKARTDSKSLPANVTPRISLPLARAPSDEDRKVDFGVDRLRSVEVEEGGGRYDNLLLLVLCLAFPHLAVDMGAYGDWEKTACRRENLMRLSSADVDHASQMTIG